MSHNITLNVNASDVNVTPVDILIKRVKTSNGLFVNYFDIGLAPSAIRVYVRNEVINFLMNLGKVQRLNTNLFLAHNLANSVVKVKARDENSETLIVNAGERYINAIMLTSSVSLAEQLQETDEEILVDYYEFQASDTKYHYILLLQYSDELSIKFGDTEYVLRRGELVEGGKKPRLNKAGVPILD